MSTAHTSSPTAPPRRLEVERAPIRSSSTTADRLALSGVFAGTVLRYLLRVLPQVSAELARWSARAAEIPGPQLRQAATEALGKRGNIEGAALFATLAPAGHRRDTVRALVAFQTAYNYLDALSELPSDDPRANGDRLHQALLAALDPGPLHLDSAHVDYYAYCRRREDGGYLTAILDACREALALLPSFALLAPTVSLAAQRIVDFQALNLSEPQGGHDALERWGGEVTPGGSGLAWWETAAAAGSSLAVHALIAAASDPRLYRQDVDEIDAAYFPSIGALHSLLDSLVDRREDHEGGRRCLLDYYDSTTPAAARLADLAARSGKAVERLPSPHAHRVIVTAMCSYYLSAPECDTAEARAITDRLERALGAPLGLAILMFRFRRLLRTVTRRAYT
jgi:tetraprenyl-beta-curcumene synthase